MNSKSHTASMENSMPPPPPQNAFITIEVPEDPHTIRALEVVCFERKFKYRKVEAYELRRHPFKGHVFYQITHTDPVQLFWLGAAFQSLLNQPTI